MGSSRSSPLQPVVTGIVFAALLVSVMFGCQKTISEHDIVTIDSSTAIKMVQGKSRLLGLGAKAGTWVDPRPATDFAKGHIPGAINIPFVDFEDLYKHKLEGLKVLVIYGNDYDDWRAKGVVKRLLAAGYGDVYMLQGGLRAWTAAGNTLEIDG